ncbi:flavin-containing monooxygenase [Pseudonocardia sp. RS010]|uniref:flavin-containing monooxygenase n=1 Tax=Pseudonocardia sp. RS010 TaxID=3385979 RepID=UPI0039A0B34B
MGNGIEDLDYEVVIIGAGVAGIYQIYRMVELGMRATVLEAAPDLGGTWYANRYPGCRFDSESYTYGYSFSRELLDEWHWKERYSPQPENLRYLNYVADKFDLRRHMQFNCRVDRMDYDEATKSWRVQVSDGRTLTTRFVVTGIGLLTIPTYPRYEGLESFRGQSFHTHDWPHEPVELAGKRVAVVGTGATGIQVIAAIADQVEQLTVFQRRPNWAAPLNNRPISEEEMAEIRSRYDEIFATCARTPGGFEHEPDRRGFYSLTAEERRAFWDELYDMSGFSIWLRNFREIAMDEAANAEFSDYIADRIRQRVNDPVIAEKLIPRDHGFGVQRLPMETNYFEVYNRSNVRLVDLSETPVEAVTESGIRTSAEDFEFDIIVYATGYDAMTGAYDKIDIRGVGGQSLREKWADGPITYMGMLVHGFPNLIFIAGPQSGSASANFPRGIETGVNWTTDLLEYMQKEGKDVVEATQEAEQQWFDHVAKMYYKVLMHKATRSWFTGYNSNIEGREPGKMRYLIYNGGAAKFNARLDEIARNDYEGLVLA